MVHGLEWKKINEMSWDSFALHIVECVVVAYTGAA
jgi:hypothetical protein